MFRKIFFIGLVASSFLFILPLSVSAENKVNVFFFWGNGCPHCAKEKPFLEQLEKKYKTLKVYKYEVWFDESNQALLKKAASALKTDIGGVPFTVIGDKYFTGYQDNNTTGKDIENAIKYCISNDCNDPVGYMLGIADKNAQTAANNNVIPETIRVPIIGEIRTKDVSLPVLTIMIGALDGFNPCAMWTLMFLISLLIGMHDKKRMWILGSTFIIASAAVYFLFMAAWLHLILFIGFILWIRLGIGFLGLGGGIYNLREYVVNKENACKVTRNPERRKVFDELKRFTQEKHFWLAMAGIIVLAAGVNIVELICSAGFPVIYTQILSLSHLPVWQYYLYLLLYIFIFMFDDLFVFIVSMLTLQMTGITTKYSRFSHLIGGILMILIGLLLIFKPELLMFG